MSEKHISQEQVTGGLPTSYMGRRFLHHAITTSTMDGARQEALNNCAEGTAVFAEQQTKGRGRLKREWLTPPGNIAVSIILYPPKSYLPNLIMLSSLSVKKAIEAVTGLACQLKWPNDVLIKGKKVCGILIETKTQIDKVDYAIIGIGINCNLHIEKHAAIQGIATSLMDELHQPVDRTALLRQLFIEMENLYTVGLKGAAIFPEWRDSLCTLGQPVSARNGDEVFEGIAEAVQEDGSLMIRMKDGDLMRFTFGDVTLRG
ncbi:MAG: biotin--[acetyl-CoA-carboxylase] ligase [Dehalococcoidales bacterium]|nr:biotin--[acetyl-CoA-carboxylase] ligase [Dehalococcoidales bacterium]